MMLALTRKRTGGKAKAALLLGLLTLVLCLIALAIALPIVLSARSSDVSAGRSSAFLFVVLAAWLKPRRSADRQPGLWWQRGGTQRRHLAPR